MMGQRKKGTYCNGINTTDKTAETKYHCQNSPSIKLVRIENDAELLSWIANNLKTNLTFLKPSVADMLKDTTFNKNKTKLKNNIIMKACQKHLKNNNSVIVKSTIKRCVNRKVRKPITSVKTRSKNENTRSRIFTIKYQNKRSRNSKVVNSDESSNRRHNLELKRNASNRVETKTDLCNLKNSKNTTKSARNSKNTLLQLTDVNPSRLNGSPGSAETTKLTSVKDISESSIPNQCDSRPPSHASHLHQENMESTTVNNSTKETMSTVRTMYDLMNDIAAIIPSWNLHILPDTNTFCISQVTRNRSGIPYLSKCIEIDNNFNAKVYIYQQYCKNFDGVYDSENAVAELINAVDNSS